MSARARHRAIALVFAALGAGASALAWRCEPELAIFLALAVIVVAVLVARRAPEAAWDPSPIAVATVPLPSHPYRGPGGALREVVPATSARAVAVSLLGAAFACAGLAYFVGVLGGLAVCWAVWTAVLAACARKRRPLADDRVWSRGEETRLFDAVDWRVLLGWPEMIIIPVLALLLVLARVLVEWVFPVLLLWPYAVATRALGRVRSPAWAAVWAAVFLLPVLPLAWI